MENLNITLSSLIDAEVVNAKIASLAKETKISKTKLTAWTLALLDSIEVPKVAPAARTGRKASEDVIALREKVSEYFRNQQEVVTSKKLAEVFGSDVVTINNVLNYLEKNTSLVKKAGLADKQPGLRGRRQVLWAAA